MRRHTLRRAPAARAPLGQLPFEEQLELAPLLEGEASWYGPGFHRKKTASGEAYNQYGLTAAHPLLPMGTRVLVENVATGARVRVRINDRGPYKKGRIVDLSRSAAIRLGMIRKGTARVRLTVLRWPTGMDPALGLRAYRQFVVQVAAYPSPARAETVRRDLRMRFEQLAFHVDRTQKGLFAIFAGPYDDERAARRVAARLQKHGVTNLVRSYRK
jgi:rare lipoprotein A